MHNIIYTKGSRTDIQEIEEFIAQDSEYYATKVRETIMGFITGLLANFPNSGKSHDDNTTRQIVEPTFKYRIIYTVSDKEIKILSISKRKNS